jgi:predicted DNA-binding protein (MmcQ/YjbR family)
MDIHETRMYCLSKAKVTECMPFDDMTLVFKLGGKMFALLSLDTDHALNLKCEPERAIELREHYDAITPGYHMNKKHWNTISLDGRLNTSLIKELVDHSYELIKESLPLKIRKELNEI